MAELTQKEKDKLAQEAITIIGNVLKLHGQDMGKKSSEEITILVNMFQEGVRYALQKQDEIMQEALEKTKSEF